MKRCILALTLLLASVLPTRADPITFELSGSITSATDPSLFTGITAGTPLSGFLTYDPTAPIGGCIGCFSYSFRLTLFADIYRLDALSPFGGPGFAWWSGFYTFRVTPSPVDPIPDQMQFVWDKDNPTGGSFWASFLTLSSHLNSAGGFSGNVTFTPVPDSGSTALLLTLGVGAVAGIRRRLSNRVRN